MRQLAVLFAGCNNKTALLPAQHSAPASASDVHATSSLKALIEFTVPIKNAHPFDIRVGRDGNLWFTQENAPDIGRITPAGKFSEFPIPAPALGIASGPDGNIWFTEPDTIGRMAENGSYKLYALPTLCSTCSRTASDEGIAPGPDNALWFGVSARAGIFKHVNVMMRITTAG